MNNLQSKILFNNATYSEISIVSEANTETIETSEIFPLTFSSFISKMKNKKQSI